MTETERERQKQKDRNGEIKTETETERDKDRNRNRNRERKRETQSVTHKQSVKETEGDIKILFSKRTTNFFWQVLGKYVRALNFTVEKTPLNVIS